jgi:hypothetical protein
MAIDRARTARGALAGAVAAGVWALQEPLDQRVFETSYSDPGLLGSFVTEDRPAQFLVGHALHLANGAAFGAIYAGVLRARLPGPVRSRGVVAALAEHVASWPLTSFTPKVPTTGRGFLQATWRHLLFGVVLGEVERRLNPDDEHDDDAYDAMVASNGHGNIEHAIIGAQG